MTGAVQPDLFEGDCFEVAVGTCIHFRPADPTPVVLAAVHNDPLPSRQTDRAHIEAAVVLCAAAHRGEVHISWLRKYVDRDVMPEMWGAVIHARRGFLEPAGYHLPSMGGSGNARKLSPVWRYVGGAR